MATWLDHTVPEHAVGLLFPPGWSSSLVETLDLSWVSTNAPLSHLHMQLAASRVPVEQWEEPRQGPRPPVGQVDQKDKGHCVYWVCCVWVCVA